MSNVQYRLLKDLILPPISGSRPSGGVTTDTEGVPSIGGENIVSSGGMDYGVLKQIPYRFYSLMPKGKLQVDDVLINKDGAQTGKVGLYDGRFPEAAINEHVFILRARDQEELDQHYLYYCVLLPETRVKIERRITGSAQPGLNSQFVKAVEIPFHKPPLQKKVARILTTIDQAIEKTKALIEKYQQIKVGLMHDLFTRGLGTDGQLRPSREQAPELYYETPIGWIPKGWDMRKLEALTLKIVDGVHHTPTYVQYGYPFVTVKNLTGTQSIDFTSLNYIDEKTHRECASRADPKPGDVLVTKDGTLGVCRIVKEGMPEFSIFVSVALLRVIDELAAEWLHLFFDSGEYLKQLGYLSSGTGLKHIHLEHFRKFLIALPERNEQKEITDKIQIVDDRLNSERNFLSKLEKQKDGLMHDLLTGKKMVGIQEVEAASV